MKTYLVGGAVRDALLGLKVQDRDWVVVGATPEQLLDVGYRQAGRDFPVFLHPQTHEEYALARTERKRGHGYKGFKAYFSPEVTLEQDLQRRDLTINAMAQDDTGQVIDPYDGQRDIEQRLLRHVSPAFAEDPLRVLRVARFAARFAELNFSIAPETLSLMQAICHSGELQYLTYERVWQEMEKALNTPRPECFFQILYQCGALAQLLPEINSLFNLPYRDSAVAKTYGDYALLCLQAAVQIAASAEVRLAVFCQALHNPQMALDRSLSILENLSQRLKWPNLYRDTAKFVLVSTQLLFTQAPINPTTAITVFDKIDAWRKPERVTMLLQAYQACTIATGTRLQQTQFNTAQLLRMFKCALAVPVAPIIAAGFKGQLIRDELQRQRMIAICRDT